MTFARSPVSATAELLLSKTIMCLERLLEHSVMLVKFLPKIFAGVQTLKRPHPGYGRALCDLIFIAVLLFFIQLIAIL